METFPPLDPDRPSTRFEIRNPAMKGQLVRLLRSIDGVTDVRRTWFEDDRIAFLYNGQRFVVNEPWGDNSHLWIGPADSHLQIDITPIHRAFHDYRYSRVPRILLWATVITFVAVWMAVRG